MHAHTHQKDMYYLCAPWKNMFLAFAASPWVQESLYPIARGGLARAQQLVTLMADLTINEG